MNFESQLQFSGTGSKRDTDESLPCCEQCDSPKGQELHLCTNQAQWHDTEVIMCNCCEECQELCRQAKAVPM